MVGQNSIYATNFMYIELGQNSRPKCEMAELLSLTVTNALLNETKSRYHGVILDISNHTREKLMKLVHLFLVISILIKIKLDDLNYNDTRRRESFVENPSTTLFCLVFTKIRLVEFFLTLL